MSLDPSQIRVRLSSQASTLQSRLRAWTFGFNVILGFTIFAYLWFGEFGYRSSVDRSLLAIGPGGSLLNPFDLSSPKLIVFAILGVSVLVIWKCERGREDRHEVLVLVGVLLLILGGMNGSQGIEAMAWGGRSPIGFRDSRLDTCLLLVAVGGLLVLAGFVRIGLDRPRRGALLGICGLFTLLGMSWFAHRYIMTPKWAQPRNAPGYVVQQLALAPSSELLMYRTLEVDSQLVELAERDGHAVAFAAGKELDERGVVALVKAQLEEATRWNTPWFQHWGLEVYIRAEASLSAGQVIPMVDLCADSGAKRLYLITRKAEPWVAGYIEIQVEDPVGLEVLVVRAKADGALTFGLGESEAEEVQALFPGIRHAPVPRAQRQKIVVAVEPDLSWQEVVTTLEEFDPFAWQVSLALLWED